MNLSDFARTHGVDPQTVQRYISRHPELRNSTIKEGKEVRLLAAGIAALEEVYPPPKPLQIIEGVPQERYAAALEKLAAAEAQIAEIQTQRLTDQRQLAQLEATQLLLGDREKQLEEERIRSREEQEKAKFADQKAEEYSHEIQILKAEIERLKSRSLWDRIRNV